MVLGPTEGPCSATPNAAGRSCSLKTKRSLLKQSERLGDVLQVYIFSGRKNANSVLKWCFSESGAPLPQLVANLPTDTMKLDLLHSDSNK